MWLSVNSYAHPGRESHGPAALVDVQQNLWEYPLRGSQLKLADGIEIQHCDPHRRLPQIACHFLDHYSDRIAEANGCGKVSSEALLRASEPSYQPCYRRPGQLAPASLSVQPRQLLADADGQHHLHARTGISFPTASRRDVLLGIRRALWQMQCRVPDENAPKVMPWIPTG